MWASPGDSVVKNLPVNAGDAGLIPESWKSPWRRKQQPTSVSYLGKPMDREAGRLSSQKSWTRLSN